MRPPVARAELDCLRVAAEPLLAAIPLGHPLAAAQEVSLSDLDGQPFVMYTAHDARYFHDTLVALFAQAKVLPRYVQHLSQIHSILALVKAGLGCAVVPASAANLHYDGVALKPLRLASPVSVELYLVWRRDQDNPMIDRLLALVRETLPT
jgi:DNA-binding transcriptional LysR family regulator